MAIRAKLLDIRLIIRLAKKHSDKPFNVRDEGLIAFAGLAYYSGHDLSLVRVSDLITERGHIVIDSRLPSTFNGSDKERYFFIGDKTYLNDVVRRIIEWRHQHGFGCLDRGLYAGLDPESKFFLKNDGGEFTLNYKNRFEGDTVTQPLQMQRHFKSFYLGEGISLSSLQDSFIANYWEAKCGQGTTQAIRDLMELTTLTKETLKTKCIRQQSSIQEILEDLYK